MSLPGQSLAHSTAPEISPLGEDKVMSTRLTPPWGDKLSGTQTRTKC